ncbi:Aste57867_19660 [Aphanomyces stellatus]|uniref:Aste57867_19660 protein n=1 Tax=Aphanomyces stellatus TaxID=120398 RepID=A0A485LHP2_9STRA|nr:hypothetical protein As57867_019595 [Aphanomyces stellatus]VFT96360.1 Aste57867_19660 [Aphanomyces stellatus]
MVFLGKISYALYLWHWPLLVFANTRFPNTRPFYMQPFVMLLVAMALSLNFTGFENRVRRLRSKFVVPSLTLAMLVVIVLSYNVYSHPSSFSMTELDLLQIEAPLDLAPSFPSSQHMNSTSTATQPMIPSSSSSNPNFTSNTSTLVSVSPSVESTPVELPNPSREKRVQATTYLQAIKGGKDIGAVWDEELVSLDATSDYGYHPHARVLNPGHESTNGLVIVLGDSHADMLKPRFLKLYHEARATNESFPTMVFKTEFGRPTLSCRPETQLDLDMVRRVKPDVVFYSFHWLQYLRPEGPTSAPLADDPRCCHATYESCPYQSPRDADELLARWTRDVKSLTAMGIKVYVAQQYVENIQYYYVVIHPDRDTYISCRLVVCH